MVGGLVGCCVVSMAYIMEMIVVQRCSKYCEAVSMEDHLYCLEGQLSWSRCHKRTIDVCVAVIADRSGI